MKARKGSGSASRSRDPIILFIQEGKILFFSYQSDIPSKSGYSIFSASHFGCLLSVGILMAIIVLIFLKSDHKKRTGILKFLPVFLLCMEASKWVVLFSIGHANIGMLPLHLCGLAAYDYLLASFLPSKKARSFFGEIAAILLGPGSVFALLMPDWTFYPVWNFFNIYGYVWHELLLLYPILLLIDKRIQLKIRHLWYEAVFLAVIVPPVYIFDKISECNFMFLNWPEPGTPLSFFASLFGNPGYLLPYAVLAFAVMTLIYIPFEIARHIRGKK